MKYVAYYRVSTQKQGKSGLGLDAQKQIVYQFAASGEIVSEFIEIESGKKNNRTELEKAIQAASAHGAKLLIAKLDRLSRNAAFIFTLRDSGVDFICCDMPDANTLTIGIFATLAQYERELISKRTKAALQAAKRRGVKLGKTCFSESAQRKATATKKRNAENNKNTQQAKEVLKDLIQYAQYKGESLSLTKCAEKLNAYGLKTARNKKFTRHNAKYVVDAVLTELNLNHLPKCNRPVLQAA